MMRSACLNHKFVYDSGLQTERLVTAVADRHQRATQSYVRRPYGVGLLVAGVDATGPHLFQTDPSGAFSEWRAAALGARSQSAKTYLERRYEAFPGLSREELIKEAVKALHGCLEPDKELEPAATVVAVVGKGERFTVYEGDAVAPFIAGLGPAAAPGGAALPAGDADEAKAMDEDAPAPAPAAAAPADDGDAPMQGV